MVLLLQLSLLVLAIPALLVSTYLMVLAVASLGCRRVPAASRRLRFDLVVPAHDEEAGIGRTVKSLLALEWPADRFRVIVVADNCSDATADRATEAGAYVLERREARRRGKGYALDFAFAHALRAGFADAVVVVDADTVVSPNLLAAFAARLESGADAVQAEYGVLNANASWRTRLMALAFALFHDVRSRGRERLGVSCGLRGNGMCFSVAALRRVPHRAFSVVEDVEYGIRLGETGIRVHYADEAAVFGEMASGAAASTTQRERWEGGRLALLRAHGTPLLARALSARDPILADLALDVLVPPLSWIVLYTGSGTIVAAALRLEGGGVANAVAPWLVSCAFIAVYVVRGIQLSGMGLRGVLTLSTAPFYVTWKLALLVQRATRRSASQQTQWIRTAREPDTLLTKQVP
jgi:1,2-diacylglycerol 3-beta-glucosyltransferase